MRKKGKSRLVEKNPSRRVPEGLGFPLMAEREQRRALWLLQINLSYKKRDKLSILHRQSVTLIFYDYYNKESRGISYCRVMEYTHRCLHKGKNVYVIRLFIDSVGYEKDHRDA